MRQADTRDVFIRAFVALGPSDDARRNLSIAQAALKKTRARVGWVPPENIHVSLFFLGNITRDLVAPVAAALDQAAAQTRPFSARIVGIGSFGGRLSPRVIWAGVADPTEIRALHERLALRLRGVGLTLETREFKPHITLGRALSPRGAQDLVKAMEALAARDFGPVACSEALLMRSVLSADGARYTILHRAAFAA
ncbi:MAG: RNA 2',3'-cyclic phosphodiesterase [Verrucomicrobiota bacterium]|nr:RNA 2',3'-cyclic phosphodiesterase [Verrucomicrobiota bacterium]